MEPQRFSWRGRLRSFVFAFSGMIGFFRNEHNARIHAVAAVLVVTAGLILKLSAMEMVAIIFSITIVWMAEIFNTAIEKVMDHLSPAIHPEVKVIKDLAAGAVLVAAIGAFITGLVIFIPRLL